MGDALGDGGAEEGLDQLHRQEQDALAPHPEAPAAPAAPRFAQGGEAGACASARAHRLL